ncbi:RNA 3'-terminal phosphate cyclase domain-containing protein [Lenzites betulinus]|nr:RNA 3'-terminal phosphate cyclase domain-containing protein [Lenzites betulinus]
MLEGGGKLLRIAIALSALLSKPIAIDNIRAGPRLVAEICSAQLEGCEVKSTSITFYPTSYTADPRTAGSIALLLQVSLPCLIFAPSTTWPPSELVLRGGTNAPQAPQVDYMQHKHFGVSATLSVHVSVPPVLGPLPAVTLTERGAVKAIHGRLAEAMRVGAIDVLAEYGVDTALISIDAAETENGCVLGGSALGSKRVDPAQLTANLAHGGYVDEHLQMIIFLALAQGKSRVKTGPLTLHTRTAIWVAEQLTDAKFSVEEVEDSVIVECEGIGYCLS